MKANWTIRTPRALVEGLQNLLPDLLWLEWPDLVLGSWEAVLGL